jgi:hypothetical protein
MILAIVAVATLAADLQQLARLPGEPSIVSAAGITADEQPILTLENRSALDPTSDHRRVVVRGVGAVEAVRWMKTSAPSRLRHDWIVSALPSSEGLDEASLKRWLTFQAADLVVVIDANDPHPANTFRAALEHAPGGRAGDHATIATRVGRDPIAIAKLLAPKYPGTPAISYIPSVAWANTLALADIAKDPSLRARVEQQTAPWRTGGQDLFGDRIQLTTVAGTFVFGDLGAPDVLAKGAEAASRVKPGDVYEYGQGWTDDMFMASVVLARSGKADLAARMLTAYASRLQRPDGVFVHAPNGPVAWGRGNGFAALGLTEALAALPATDPNRAALLDGYRRQMSAAMRLQSPDGMWNEVLDEAGSYREESATAMLMTAMSRGVRAGWIDRSYVSSIERAWRGVAAHVTEDGTIVDVCTGTGAGPTKRYYLDRAAITGADDRGGAMALLAAIEIHALQQGGRH